jgi:hypothetical protein
MHWFHAVAESFVSFGLDIACLQGHEVMVLVFYHDAEQQLLGRNLTPSPRAGGLRVDLLFGCPSSQKHMKLIS